VHPSASSDSAAKILRRAGFLRQGLLHGASVVLNSKKEGSRDPSFLDGDCSHVSEHLPVWHHSLYQAVMKQEQL